MRFYIHLCSMVLAGLLVAGSLAACKKEGGEGPAERGGKQIDKAMDKAGQEMEKAGDKIKEAVKDATK
jgi:hypothetical protein